MTLFIVGIVILLLIILGCSLWIVKLTKQEKEYMEVSNQYLKDIGKNYTKEEFSMAIFELYRNIIQAVQDENYLYLRESLSDEIYNSYLMAIKNSKERNAKTIVEDMNPVFSKLISLAVKDNMEIAKVWLKVNYHEYIIDTTPPEELGTRIEPRVIGGSKTKLLEKEYILTLVKTRTEKESVVCANCGYVTNVVTRNTCVRCGANVVSRHYHWVMVAKEETRTSSR